MIHVNHNSGGCSESFLIHEDSRIIGGIGADTRTSGADPESTVTATVSDLARITEHGRVSDDARQWARRVSDPLDSGACGTEISEERVSLSSVRCARVH
jgi:hypothetical protein